MSGALFALLLGLASVLLALRAFATPVWTPDGFIYAQMMLVDRGVPREAARAQVAAFYLSSTRIGRNERYRRYFLNERLGMFTPEAKPFASRVLYPLFAAPLYPLSGFKALPLVSVLAYVAATLAVYWCFLALCRPAIAALATLLFAAAPVIQSIAAAALTDMLALFFLTIALGSVLRYSLSGRLTYVAVMACSVILLALTRPLPYVPLCAAIAVVAWARIRRDGVQTRRGLWLCVAALAGWAAYIVAASVTKTPSLSVHLHWLYAAAKTHWIYSDARPLSQGELQYFSAWYQHEIAWAAKAFAATTIRSVYPVVALAFCVTGLYLRRESPVSALLAGFIAGCGVGIFANPVAIELPRLVEAPASIAVAAGIALAIEYAAVLRPPGIAQENLPERQAETLGSVRAGHRCVIRCSGVPVQS